ncbi:MAG: hypothetical protein ABEJ57_03955 [Halobacteriaceae archaeon]
MVWPVDDLVRLAEIIADVALGDPLSLALVAVGALLMGGSILVVGYLTLAGLVTAAISS